MARTEQPVIDLLLRAMNPEDQTLAAEAGPDVRRKLARKRYGVVVACLDEIQAESAWHFTTWRANAACRADYSRIDSLYAYLQIRLLAASIRVLAYSTLILRVPVAPVLCNRAIAGLRLSLQTA